MSNIVKINAPVLKSPASMEEYLKPMSRDILLFTTKIADTYKLPDKTALRHLQVGMRLNFSHQQSKYEENQIVILDESEQLVGYVPEGDAAIFARLMEAGKMLFASVKSVSHTVSVPLIEIDIYLQDF